MATIPDGAIINPQQAHNHLTAASHHANCAIAQLEHAAQVLAAMGDEPEPNKTATARGPESRYLLGFKTATVDGEERLLRMAPIGATSLERIEAYFEEQGWLDIKWDELEPDKLWHIWATNPERRGARLMMVLAKRVMLD